MLEKLEPVVKILGGIAALVTILGGIAAVTKWGRNQYTKFWHLLTRCRPKVPRETIRLIPQYRHNWWSLGSSKGEPAMDVVCDLHITNISKGDVLICEVSLRKPKTIGHISTHHPHQNIYVSSIPPGCTTEARAHFWIQPPICKDDEPLVVDIDFVDQFGNIHRARNVTFRPSPKKKEQPPSPQLETVSDISDPVEREVVAVLQAELNRYKDCGRGVGGLGSIQTTYQGQSYHGFGADWREVNSPKMQAIVPDPKNAKVESDNASVLIKFYGSLKNPQRKVFVDSLLKRLSRETAYASVGYFIVFVLHRFGYLNKALEIAKKELQGDSAYGFSDVLKLLDGLLKYEYPKFSTGKLNNIEQFLKDIKREDTFKISERLSDARTILLAKRTEEERLMHSKIPRIEGGN